MKFRVDTRPPKHVDSGGVWDPRRSLSRQGRRCFQDIYTSKAGERSSPLQVRSPAGIPSEASPHDIL